MFVSSSFYFHMLYRGWVDYLIIKIPVSTWGLYDLKIGAKMSDGKLRETQTANHFSDIYPIDCAVLSANAQSCQKCCTLLSVLFCA